MTKTKKVINFIACAILSATLAASAFGCTMGEEYHDGNTGGNASDNASGGNNGGTAQHEHDYVVVKSVAADCLNAGYDYYWCSGCGNSYSIKTSDALGHDYAETSVSARRIRACTREGCNSGIMTESEHTYDEQLAYTFTEDEAEKLDDLYASMLKRVEDIGKYADEQYDETSTVYQEYCLFEDEAYYYVNSLNAMLLQKENAALQYDIDMTSETALANYQYITEYYAKLYQNYCTILRPIAESKFKIYFYLDMTDEEIEDFVSAFEDTGNKNSQLKKENNELLLEYYAVNNVSTDSSVPEIYAAMVANNNQIAANLGYDNYMQYAYDDIYAREYTYEDAAAIAAYMKKYLSPCIATLANKYNAYYRLLTDDDMNALNSILTASFFTDVKANGYVNDFFDKITECGTFAYADEFEALMKDGNYYLGTYNGAYTVYNKSISMPVLVMGENYRRTNTVVHEFGHYNEYLYSNDKYAISFDLAETHSQGLEMLYLSYLKSTLTETAGNALEAYQLYTSVRTVLTAMSVNIMEQAVYTNTYTGTNWQTIMADGQITSDEYDLLFESILYDFGLYGYVSSSYWRYSAIPAAGYYVSYAVSLVGSMQLYTVAQNESFESAVAKYEKLLTFADDDTTMTYSQILEYAALDDFKSEALYASLNTLLTA